MRAPRLHFDDLTVHVSHDRRDVVTMDELKSQDRKPKPKCKTNAPSMLPTQNDATLMSWHT